MKSRYRIVRDRRILWPYTLAALAGVAVLLGWTQPWAEPPRPSIRALCDAEGGIVVQAVDGPVCIWAGAVIPIQPGG